MQPRLLDKYAAKEFLIPFLLSVAGFTILLISGYLFELSDLLFVKKAGLSTVLKLLGYKVPSVVTLTLPIGVLFATFLSLGRMSRDNELTVIRCAGCSFVRFVAPYLILGLCISGVTYYANEKIVPDMNHREANIVRKLIFRDALPAVEEQVFFRDPEDRFFYIRKVDRQTKTLYGIMIYMSSDDSRFPGLVTANEGTYTDKTWHLVDGVKREFDANGFVQQEAHFEEMHLVTQADVERFFGEQKTTDEMNRAELREHITLFQKSGIKVTSFEVDYHLKLALPFASLIFVVVAAPLAAQTGRGGRFAGVVASLGIMFLYYVVTSVARSLGANGTIVPWISAWIGNGLFFVVGCLAVAKAEKG